MKFTNNTDIPLGLAVWLLHDEYDYIDTEDYISVTSLMRPVKQTILSSRVSKDTLEVDIDNFVASSMGTALHDSIEKAWLKGHSKALEKLGYPDSAVKRVLVNPSSEQLKSIVDPIPIYLEQRSFAKVGKWTVGGKFDMVLDGTVIDNKSTSAFSWLFGTKEDDYRLQLSLYRWLNPALITEDVGQINYIFTDWKKSDAVKNPKYPQKRLEYKEIVLTPINEINIWVKERLSKLEKYWDKPESEIPDCTDAELWRAEPKYKYYKDATKTDGKSTKNFDNLAEAMAYKSEKGNVGSVLTFPGSPKRCQYCNAYSICKQKDQYYD